MFVQRAATYRTNDVLVSATQPIIAPQVTSLNHGTLELDREAMRTCVHDSYSAFGVTGLGTRNSYWQPGYSES
eukprot:1250800-Amphidinium_carterae.1